MIYTSAVRSARVLLALAACIAPMLVISAARAATTTLYNGTGSPNGQGFTYLAQPFGSASATQMGNNLNTTPKTSDSAGFFGNAVPTLDRVAGYTVRFSAQLNAETHAGSDKNADGVDDRAGFSIIVLSSDKKGIELGFWTDRVWAQNDGITGPTPGTLFTHGEEGAANTTVATTYDLIINGDVYTLKSGTTTILSGPIRDYTAFGSPYTSSNFLFLGDDTPSAAANVTFTGPIAIADNSHPSPTITAASAVARARGSTGSSAPIATVSDDLDSANSLAVSAVSVPSGLTVTNISNVNGATSATVTAACGATLGANTVTLRVTDSGGLTADANLTVNVDANTPPTLGSYANTTIAPGSSATITPSAPPSDNGTLKPLAVSAPSFTGTLAVNSAGVLSVGNAGPAGSYVVTLTATDNCDAATSTTFTLTVTDAPTTPTPGTPTPPTGTPTPPTGTPTPTTPTPQPSITPTAPTTTTIIPRVYLTLLERK